MVLDREDGQLTVPHALRGPVVEIQMRLDDVLYKREEAAPEISIVYGQVE